MVVYSVNDQWQIDLFDFSKYSHWNSGYKYLLCVVDVFSRKAFVAALKRKSDTTDAMSKILVKDTPILIQSDNGTEFLNKSFQRLLKSMNVRHITVDVGNHKRQGIVERFNRTIALLISRYQESRNTNRYIDVLDDLVYNFNHTMN
jgi:transposase InsO family protein